MEFRLELMEPLAGSGGLSPPGFQVLFKTYGTLILSSIFEICHQWMERKLGMWDYIRFHVDENAQQTNHNNAIILIFRRKDGRWLRRGPAISDCLSEPCRRLRLYLPPPFPPLDPLSLPPIHAACSSSRLENCHQVVKR